jgi:6-pyruvoyl-tetrahydropterin synthase
MLVDFEDLKAAVDPLVKLLDHRHLNDFIRQPTAENIAAWFGAMLGRMADTHILKLVTVTVHETDTCTAEWASVNDLEVIRHFQSWREPDNITEDNKELMAVARRAATDAVNVIILSNRPRVRALLGDGGGTIG